MLVALQYQGYCTKHVYVLGGICIYESSSSNTIFTKKILIHFEQRIGELATFTCFYQHCFEFSEIIMI